MAEDPIVEVTFKAVRKSGRSTTITVTDPDVVDDCIDYSARDECDPSHVGYTGSGPQYFPWLVQLRVMSRSGVQIHQQTTTLDTSSKKPDYQAKRRRAVLGVIAPGRPLDRRDPALAGTRGEKK